MIFEWFKCTLEEKIRRQKQMEKNAEQSEDWKHNKKIKRKPVEWLH